MEIKLKNLDYSPCFGVYVGIVPKFVVETSVKASLNATLMFTLGIGYNSNDGFVNKSQKPSFKPELKIEGKIFIGFDLGPHAYVASEKVAKVELGSEIGALLTAVLSTDNGDNHLCNSCLDGDIDLVGELTGKLVFGEKTRWENSLDINFLNIKIDIIDFYYSNTYKKFGWGSCPLTNNNSSEPGENPSVPDDENYDCNKNGCYYTLTVLKKATCTDNGKGKYICNYCGKSYIDVIPATGHNFLNGECTFCSIKKGSCGDNLTWIFNDSTGILTISGSGDMDDYSSYNKPWEDYESDIKKVIIKNGVTTIGENAFFYCSSLTSVTIPDSVTSIGDYAFGECTSLTRIIIPASVTEIGTQVFLKCTNLICLTVDDNNQSYSSDEYGVLFNKDKTILIQYPIGNTRTGYTIPDSVTTIGEDAFNYCTSLTNVTIPDSVTTIAGQAFSFCISLTSVTIPDSVTTIAGHAFSYCFNLANIELPNSITRISDCSFLECTSLTSVTIPDSVTTIGGSAFHNCTSLTGVTIPDSIITIEGFAFISCNSLTDVYYSGTQEQWNNISIFDYNDPLLNATIHYNSTGSMYSLRVNQGKVLSLKNMNTSSINNQTATASNAIVGNEYTIVVLKNTADINDFTDNELLYIDQKTAEQNGDITFNYVPKSDERCIVYIIGVFSDTNLVKQEQVSAHIHTEEEIPAVAPTCTVSGFTAGIKCSVCDEILIAPQEISVLGHEYESVVKTPTCAVGGYTTYTCSACGDSYIADETDATGHSYSEGNCIVCGTKDPSYYEEPEYNYTFSIQTPSRTEIRNRDGIYLHAVIDGNAPEGSYIEWERSNANFITGDEGEGVYLIVADDKGYTTFTATLYDAEGNALATDSVEMYSKSGFFDKIGGFFRSLFGTTKIYEN